MTPVGAPAVRDVALPSGLSCHVVEAGPGAGAPSLVYLHGAGGVSAEDPILLALAARWNVVAPVAPGFRDLGELADIADVHDLAIHYDDVFGALGLEGATVVGHSFGGMVAAELAAHYPSRVGRLVLCDPVGLWSDDEPVADVFGVGVTELAPILFGDADSPAAKAMQEGMTALDGADAEAVADRLIPTVQGFSAAAKFMWPIPDKGLVRRLRRIQAPTLLLWGAEDRLVPAGYAERFRGAIGDARVHIVPAAGHMLPVEAPEAFVEAIGEFLG